MAARKSINIGLMGLGVIGGGVVKVLTGKPDTLAREAGSKLVLKKVLENFSSSSSSFHSFFLKKKLRSNASSPPASLASQLVSLPFPFHCLHEIKRKKRDRRRRRTPDE